MKAKLISNAAKKLLASKVLRQTAIILLEQQLNSQHKASKYSSKTSSKRKNYSAKKQ